MTVYADACRVIDAAIARHATKNVAADILDALIREPDILAALIPYSVVERERREYESQAHRDAGP